MLQMYLPTADATFYFVPHFESRDVCELDKHSYFLEKIAVSLHAHMIKRLTAIER